MLSPISEKFRRHLGNVVLSDAEIKVAIQSLARRIEDEFLPGDFAMVPILPGAIFFAVDLIRAIRIPVKLFPAALSSKLTKQNEDGSCDYDVTCQLHGSADLPSKCLVVGPVADNTTDFVDFAADTVLKNSSVKTCKTAVLFRTQDCHESCKPDFIGLDLDIDTSPFVGYGLTYRGNYGQLPSICELRRVF